MKVHKNILSRWIVASVSVVGIIGASGLAATAHAATFQNGNGVHAVHRVWLRSGPHFGHDGITREAAGTTFTVLPGSTVHWWHVQDQNGTDGYVTKKTYWVQGGNASSGTATSAPLGSSTSRYTTSAQLPPGVWYDDSSVNPIAGLNATWQQKSDAVLQIAKSKLGTPYRWGHNEDRGQYGFDCSNFDEYVYHHALGYRFSGASRVQARSVGRKVPRSQMQPGDLLIFNHGGHTGIYIGHNEMIEEGGGLGKVGYLSVAPGSYWGNHLTAVKRMF